MNFRTNPHANSFAQATNEMLASILSLRNGRRVTAQARQSVIGVQSPANLPLARHL